MNTTASSGNQTLAYDGGSHQVSVVNKDTSNALNVKINADPTGQTVEASGARGWRVNKGVYTVQITASGSWEVTVQ